MMSKINKKVFVILAGVAFSLSLAFSDDKFLTLYAAVLFGAFYIARSNEQYIEAFKEAKE